MPNSNLEIRHFKQTCDLQFANERKLPTIRQFLRFPRFGLSGYEISSLMNLNLFRISRFGYPDTFETELIYNKT